MTQRTATHGEPRCDGRLKPWIDSAGELGWHAVASSHCLATSVARALHGTVVAGDHGEWWTRIPCSAIPAVAIQADARAMWYTIGPHDGGARVGVFRLRSAPWTTGQLTTCPLTDLPLEGQLSVHAVVLDTRMGRQIRYLAPTFTPA